MEQLRGQAGRDKEATIALLNALFAVGTPPSRLHGTTSGMLLATTTTGPLDAAVKVLTSVWMPWQGKRFDQDAASGDNRMTGSSSLVGRLVWPLYSMRPNDGERAAFDFTTYVEPGKENPDRDVLVIDYSDIPDNPTLVIRSIRDELVELTPGAYLGKIFFRMPKLSGHDNFERIGFFALRTP
ncbi:hypothetical protein [Williamsia sterculiae]|uniref:hypothetical protein n=1 Tax=Williamsia sterculiae TaxID=1344003 RepID=UPI001F2DD4CC|nr:hypothetical protein [Williamsia sterculiae]